MRVPKGGSAKWVQVCGLVVYFVVMGPTRGIRTCWKCWTRKFCAPKKRSRQRIVVNIIPHPHPWPSPSPQLMAHQLQPYPRPPSPQPQPPATAQPQRPFSRRQEMHFSCRGFIFSLTRNDFHVRPAPVVSRHRFLFMYVDFYVSAKKLIFTKVFAIRRAQTYKNKHNYCFLQLRRRETTPATTGDNSGDGRQL